MENVELKHKTMLYEPLENQRVHCFLCSHHCRIAPSNNGICGVRRNEEGILYTMAYGSVIASHIDPIEKKPLYHFLPGSESYSIATIGCNFRCGFCQNWEISQVRFTDAVDTVAPDVVPEGIVKEALKLKCASISYTYTEPTIFFEYAMDTALLAKEKGLKNVFVTNGYMTSECLKMAKSFLDAANVDLKFFDDAAYQKNCQARLQPVKETIRLMREMGIWVEVTTLVVPGENDSLEQLRGIAEFISGVDKNIPWHVSRFHPDYKLTDRPATPVETLKKALAIGQEAGLTYIYAGNVHGFGSDTICPHCQKTLIKREGLRILESNIKSGACFSCQRTVPGVF